MVVSQRKKRPYPRKKDEERRIPVSLSLSGDALKYFRDAYALSEGHVPSEAEIKEKAKDWAYQGIAAYIKQYIEIEEAIFA